MKQLQVEIKSLGQKIDSQKQKKQEKDFVKMYSDSAKKGSSDINKSETKKDQAKDAENTKDDEASSDQDEQSDKEQSENEESGDEEKSEESADENQDSTEKKADAT